MVREILLGKTDNSCGSRRRKSERIFTENIKAILSGSEP
jgi:hypothetical protein